MDASQLFGTIIRILNQPVFPPRAKPAHAGKSRPVAGRPHKAGQSAPVPLARVEAVRPAVPTGSAPITVTPVSAPAPLAAAPASTQAMRTLEEVRADLARLRDQAKRRQAASAQARRERAFAPTDFMTYGDGLAPAEPTAAQGAFAPTDFMDMGPGTRKPS